MKYFGKFISFLASANLLQPRHFLIFLCLTLSENVPLETNIILWPFYENSAKPCSSHGFSPWLCLVKFISPGCTAGVNLFLSEHWTILYYQQVLSLEKSLNGHTCVLQWRKPLMNWLATVSPRHSYLISLFNIQTRYKVAKIWPIILLSLMWCEWSNTSQDVFGSYPVRWSSCVCFFRLAMFSSSR